MSTSTYAVISLLDREHRTRVEALWRMLRERFGIHGVESTPHPHVSYVVLEGVDRTAIVSRLATLAASTAPFTLRATGIGVFAGDEPVIYVPVVRSAAIDAMHESIERLSTIAPATIDEVYRGDRWLPHITLARGDVDADTLAAAVRELTRNPIDWAIAIDNLTLVDDASGNLEGTPLRLQRFELNPRQ